MSLTHLPAWQRLVAHRDIMQRGHLRDWFHDDPQRFDRLSMRVDDLLVDFSKHLINGETLTLLRELARACDVEGLRDRMFAGERINTTEQRAVLHVALRHRGDAPILLDGRDVMPDVRAALDHLREFSDDLRNGAWTGYSGRRITDVVNIGIGGSDLGPAMVAEALTPYARQGPRLHFVSNVDGAHLDETLRPLSPETTLFIVASKTFTTEETMLNAGSARQWFLAHATDERHIARHFVAVSTNAREVAAFGIDADNMFVFWDWVGGRYSLWSSIGLSIAVAVGYDTFSALLDGAYRMDTHFRTEPVETNLPMTLALLGVWYTDLLGADSHAVLPYDQYLRRLPAFLQQLDMESNGKRVTKDGATVEANTGPVIWGEPGTNGQHAFYQLLHQGTRLIPCDFLIAAHAAHDWPAHQLSLIANCLAQSEALAFGKTADAVRHELTAQSLAADAVDALVPHKTFPGNRPSTTFAYSRLDARTLGMILALYEHKVFVMGAIWGINSFDQWGVELGKQLAKRIRPELEAGGPVSSHDSSTNGLMAFLKKARSTPTEGA